MPAIHFQGAISSVAYLIGMVASIINLQQWDKSVVDFREKTNTSVYGDISGKKVPTDQRACRSATPCAEHALMRGRRDNISLSLSPSLSLSVPAREHLASCSRLHHACACMRFARRRGETRGQDHAVAPSYTHGCKCMDVLAGLQEHLDLRLHHLHRPHGPRRRHLCEQREESTAKYDYMIQHSMLQ